MTALVLVFVLFLVVFSLTEYRPESLAAVPALYDGAASSAEGLRQNGDPPESLRILSWNIGYGGLNAGTDFFLEGGAQRKPPPEAEQQASLQRVAAFLARQDPDIALLQEVDSNSRRSYRVDQTALMAGALPDHDSRYALNYKCLFVPVPPAAPIGRVRSGVQTLGRFPPVSAERHSLPGEPSWPVRLFHLKRCALVTRFPSAVPGRDWIIINLHLSAYGDGTQRQQQLAYLKAFIQDRYREGHYVVAGGDWNSLFPGLSRDQFGPYETAEEHLFWLQRIPEGWTPGGWQWCYDPAVPTSRSLDRPYREGRNFTAVIDGFLVSPNLAVEEVEGVPLGFRDSDHNPVLVTVAPRS